MTKGKRGAERASTAADLVSLPSTKILRQTWKLVAEKAVPPDGPKVLHPCFDSHVGLNPLARAVILRNVLKTEIRRDYKEPLPDASWQIGIVNQTHAFELFSERALGTDPTGWLNMSGENTATLYDLNWRNKLCDGFVGALRVAGLNEWFSSRYQRNLTGGRMTARLLFETRFFGANAIDNYIRFLLHGIYVPSANHTLSSHLPYSDVELSRDGLRAGKLEELLERVCGVDNEGQPIITVSCENNPTAGSRFATTLVSKLGERMRSACYIPLAKPGSKGQLNDHGYRSVVEAIHRFITGEISLDCSAKEHGEAELARMVRQVRHHLTTVPTVFVFDGFSPGASAFPALVSFIRDEPIDRLLRLIQHPETGDWLGHATENLQAFRQTYFVIVGAPTRRWMEMHRQRTIDLEFTLRDQSDILNKPHMANLRNALNSAPKRIRSTSPSPRTEETLRGEEQPAPWAQSERRLNALSFLSRLSKLSDQTDPEELEKVCFHQYWIGLRSWQRLFLRALAISESGLRWSTSMQVFETYARLGRRPDSTNEEELGSDSVGAEQFKKFIDVSTAATTSAPMLFEYSDGLEADSYDIFDFPSQAISRLNDGHPWIMARRQKRGRWLQTVDFCDVSFKRLVRAATTPREEFIIRRILAELCLQNYRVRLRHSRTARRVDRRAARNLAEALLHGMMSIELPSDGVNADPALPKFAQGEIPTSPEAAFSFLYEAIFTDLFCDGDPTNIARVHGNGELQLEMLMLMSGRTPVGAPQPALLDPEQSIHVPPWWNDSSKALQHLLAIARSAKRAGRAEVLRVALDRIDDYRNQRPLLGPNVLSYTKLFVDHEILSHEGSWTTSSAGIDLRKQLLRAVVGCVSGAPTDAAIRIHRELSGLKRQVVKLARQYQEIIIAPEDIEASVNRACAGINRILPPEKLPKETLTALTRLAWAESVAGDHLQRHGQCTRAFEQYLLAVSIHWLRKALAVQLRKFDPDVVPRVGFSATEGYMHTVLKLKEYLARSTPKHAHLRDRMLKSARNTLDTFTREQGVRKADHIAALVLECAYVRATLPPTKQLAKLRRTNSKLPTGDERLTSLSRCLQWLRTAELEMLSFSGQPAMRVMLCRERIVCVIDMLSRVAERLEDENRQPIERMLDSDDGAPYVALVDILTNDLRQYRHFIGFMGTYSSSARFMADEWKQDRRDLLDTVRKKLDDWKAGLPGTYNEMLNKLRDLA